MTDNFSNQSPGGAGSPERQGDRPADESGAFDAGASAAGAAGTTAGAGSTRTTKGTGTGGAARGAGASASSASSGETRGGFDVGHILDRAYENRSLAELLDAPVSALQGVSDADAEKLRDAFKIRTVRDLATNKYFLRAQGLYLLSGEQR